MTQKPASLQPSCAWLSALFLLVASAGSGWAAPKEPGPAPGGAAGKVDFGRDIRPILSDNCFACHGPDDAKRKAGLRLDQKEPLFRAAKSGARPVVAGQTGQSELLRRVTAQADDEHMPPAESGKKLTAQQIELLRRWIEQGAEYRSHWAFAPLQAPALPSVRAKSWPRNGIDHFILARLEQERLKPGGEASRETLMRRVTLDLTGLPPTPAEVSEFLADQSVDAYDKLVDRLLRSPHYGERMALEWLDAARYADTHGYHIDSARDMTHWRDWVIGAFNDNEPFDQFTIEQLAGDLLPNATVHQKVASGFNRNHMINYEGGAIPEEYQTAYLIDRVNTTATVWLGLTLACAQCHDHKYDALTMKDYYRFYAFFNNVPEKGLDGREGNAVPILKLPSETQSTRLAALRSDVREAEAGLKAADEELPGLQAKWEQQLASGAEGEDPAGWTARFPLHESLEGENASAAPIPAKLNEGNPKWTAGLSGRALQLDGKDENFVVAGDAVHLESTQAFSYGCWVRQSGKGTGALFARMDDASDLRGFDLLLGDGKLHLHLIHAWPTNALRVVAKSALPKDAWTHVLATYDGSSKASGVKLYVNGVSVPFEVTHDSLSGSLLTSVPFQLGKRSASHPLQGALADVRIYPRALSEREAAGLALAPFGQMAQRPADQRSDEDKKRLTDLFRERHAPRWQEAKGRQSSAKKALEQFERSIPNTMVMGEQETPRDTFMLVRGQYDKKGDKVSAGTPAALPPLPEGAPGNRLGLARWIVAPEQPLTARVIVNRYWQMYFGNGIVSTSENFGSQADAPSHPELLDWLASQFTRSGWNVKTMQRLIVTSATYRQSSVQTAAGRERDPENRLLGRGARLRLPAEFIRDQALAVAGLLDDRIGGASVFPYQPPGLWEELMVREDGDNFTAQKYQQSHGRDLYRRSLYTFWKRTSPPSTLGTLDAPDRQTCVVRRQRTNTPLQALLLMNDPTFVEAARKLAERLLTEAEGDRQRIELAYRLALTRAPKAAELDVLLQLYRAQLASYRADAASAARVLHVGESELPPALDPAQLAAWTMVASAILNLDETITKG